MQFNSEFLYRTPHQLYCALQSFLECITVMTFVSYAWCWLLRAATLSAMHRMNPMLVTELGMVIWMETLSFLLLMFYNNYFCWLLHPTVCLSMDGLLKFDYPAFVIYCQQNIKICSIVKCGVQIFCFLVFHMLVLMYEDPLANFLLISFRIFSHADPIKL